MNCCSNDEMAGESITSVFRAGLNTLHGTILWLFTLTPVLSVSSEDSTSVWGTSLPLSSDAIVSLLFVIHVVVVVAFIISHCTVKKKKSE